MVQDLRVSGRFDRQDGGDALAVRADGESFDFQCATIGFKGSWTKCRTSSTESGWLSKRSSWNAFAEKCGEVGEWR